MQMGSQVNANRGRLREGAESYAKALASDILRWDWCVPIRAAKHGPRDRAIAAFHRVSGLQRPRRASWCSRRWWWRRADSCRRCGMALALRKPPPGCIQHTDRGSQYCAHEYQKLLLKHQLLPSMSGKGNCFDNSAVESFFKSLKAELIWRRHWQTRRDIEIAIFEYINGFYNPRRRHSTLGWKSPVAFEKKAA